MRRLLCLLTCSALVGALPATLSRNLEHHAQQDSKSGHQSGQYQFQQELLRSHARQQQEQELASHTHGMVDEVSDKASERELRNGVDEPMEPFVPSLPRADNDPEPIDAPIVQPIQSLEDPTLASLDSLLIYGAGAEQPTDDFAHDTKDIRSGSASVRKIVIANAVRKIISELNDKKPTGSAVTKEKLTRDEEASDSGSEVAVEGATEPLQQDIDSSGWGWEDEVLSTSRINQEDISSGDEIDEPSNADLSAVKPEQVSSVAPTDPMESSSRTEAPTSESMFGDSDADITQCDPDSTCSKAADCYTALSSTNLQTCFTSGNAGGICCNSKGPLPGPDSMQSVRQLTPAEPTMTTQQPTPTVAESTPADSDAASTTSPELKPHGGESSPNIPVSTTVRTELASIKTGSAVTESDNELARPELTMPEAKPINPTRKPPKPKPDSAFAKTYPTTAEPKPSNSKPESTNTKTEPTTVEAKETTAQTNLMLSEPDLSTIKSELTMAKTKQSAIKSEHSTTGPEATIAKHKQTTEKPKPIKITMKPKTKTTDTKATSASLETSTRAPECPEEHECVALQSCGAEDSANRSNSATPEQPCQPRSGEPGGCCGALAEEGTEILCSFSELCVQPDTCGADGFILNSTDRPGASDDKKKQLGAYGTFCRLPLGGRGRCCRLPDPEWPSGVPVPGCGHSHHIPLPGDDSRHVREALFGEIPWQATIFEKGTNRFICGGTIVSARNVLTSDHCVLKYHNTQLFIRVGDYIIHQDSEPLSYQDLEVFSIRSHPYVGALFNDIVVMELTEEIRFGPHVQPICLPQRGQKFVGERCIISGWGKPAFVGNYSERLERLEVPVVDQAVCVQNLRDTHLGHFFHLDESMMCAGGEKDVDACRGDAGGPLACRSLDGSYVLAGVAAWSVACSRHGVPSVYTSVSGTLGFTARHITGGEFHPFYRSNGGVTRYY